MQILTDSASFVGAGIGDWQHQMRDAIRDPRLLIQLLNLPDDAVCRQQASGAFRLFVPRPYLGRIKPGDIDDPLLRQVLPISEESIPVAGYSADPLEEDSFCVSPGLLKKYNERALLIVNGTCAVHCRYCFRRHFPYSDSVQNDRRLEDSLKQIAGDDSIREVILSGGDPLTMVDQRLGQWVRRLEQLPNVERLRIHSRLPVVIPQRVTDELLSMIGGSRLETVVVIHANHANELDNSVAVACEKLRNSCNAVLNQSVLLRGVNNNVDALKGLSERLISCGVVPYYLHQLDKVAGAAHFHVPIDEGLELMSHLRASAAGYLVPRYVREIPGEANKTVLA